MGTQIHQLKGPAAASTAAEGAAEAFATASTAAEGAAAAPAGTVAASTAAAGALEAPAVAFQQLSLQLI